MKMKEARAALNMMPTRRVVLLEGVYRCYVQAPSFMGTPERHVDMNESQYGRYVSWCRGVGMIQDLLPDLSDDDREILINGLVDDDLKRLSE